MYIIYTVCFVFPKSEIKFYNSSIIFFGNSHLFMNGENSPIISKIVSLNSSVDFGPFSRQAREIESQNNRQN